MQESKLGVIDLFIWRSIGRARLDRFSSIPAVGTAGGIIIGWNSILFDGKMLFTGSFYLSMEFRNKTNNVSWVCTSVYGPNARHLKPGFWNELRTCQPNLEIPWVICGDFNSIFSPSDKSNGLHNREDIRLAQYFMSDMQLLEPPSFGKCFTWTNGQTNPTWVKLDHFLVNSN